jgi:hypothetical protein
MTISRRSFLSGVGPVLAVAAAGSLQGSSRSESSRAGNDLREDVFRPLIGSRFEVHDQSHRRGTVSLVDVESLDAKKNRTRHAFALRFQGAQLAQGTYRFKQAGREFVLFVVPGARSTTPTLTAIVNRV